jgi:hypothetical protein
MRTVAPQISNRLLSWEIAILNSAYEAANEGNLPGNSIK